jgi:hypothetical protein
MPITVACQFHCVDQLELGGSRSPAQAERGGVGVRQPVRDLTQFRLNGDLSMTTPQVQSGNVCHMPFPRTIARSADQPHTELWLAPFAPRNASSFDQGSRARHQSSAGARVRSFSIYIPRAIGGGDMQATWQSHERRWRGHRSQQFAARHLGVPASERRACVLPAESAEHRPEFASLDEAVRELATWRFREDD